MRDIALGDTFDVKFTTTEPDTGAPATLSGTPVVSAYVGNSTTEITAGITLSADFDGRTGLNNVRVVATSGNGFADNTDVTLVITTGTVDGVSAVGYVIEQFTIGRGAAYRRLGAPAGASVSADVAAVKAETASLQSDTNDIQTRLPAALVSGRMDASVGAMAANVMTAAAAAADLTTELQSGLATAANLATVDGIVDDIKQMLGHKTTIATLASQTSFTLTAGSADDNSYNGWAAFLVDQSTATQIALGVVSDYTGSTKTVTLREDPGIFTMATGDTIILLPGKLTDGVNVIQIEGEDATDQLDAHAAAGLDAAGVRAAVGLASANLDTQLSGIQSDTNDIQTRLPAALVSGRMDASVGAMAANVMTAAAAAADLTTELQSGLATSAAVSSLQSDVTSIQSDTNDIQARLPAALVGGRIDASVGAMASGVLTAAAIAGDAFTAAKFAADVTTELQSGLATAANLATVDGIVDDIKQMLGHKTTIATLASQTSFTLTAGSADDNTYNGWGAYVVDQSTATQVALGVVSDYTGSTKTVTLREDPAIFTMAVGDTIILLPGKLTDTVSADLRSVMGNPFTGSTKPYDTTA